MEYISDKHTKYTDKTTVACFYTYNKCCILYGEVSPNKTLIIHEEFNFEKKSVVFIADFLKRFDEYIWINKNDHLGSLIGRCYCVDFLNVEEMAQLADLFSSLVNENRVVFSYEKKVDSARENALPIIVRAFSYLLFNREAYPKELFKFIQL